MTNILIVDENDQPIGSASQAEARAKGLHHRIVRVLLKDESGLLLLQKRSASKSYYPGRWTDSASGHVDEGETYEQAMRRELQEELGITADIKFLGKFLSTHTNDEIKTPVFNGVFEGHILNGKKLKLNDEVSETRWMKLADIKSQIARKPDNFTPGLIDTIARFY